MYEPEVRRGIGYVGQRMELRVDLLHDRCGVASQRMSSVEILDSPDIHFIYKSDLSPPPSFLSHEGEFYGFNFHSI